jgi:hypothetical protein
MLHEKSIKVDIVQKLQEKVKQATIITQCEELYFNNEIGSFTGVKLHQGRVFLVKENTGIVYPIGIHGSILKQVFTKVRNHEFYGYSKKGEKKYKVNTKKIF